MIKWHLKKTHTKLLLLGLAFWSIGDIATTWAGFSIGIPEGNPAFAWLTLETFLAGILVKALGVMFFALVVNYLAKMEKSNIHWTDKLVSWFGVRICITAVLVLGFCFTITNFALVLKGVGV